MSTDLQYTIIFLSIYVIGVIVSFLTFYYKESMAYHEKCNNVLEAVFIIPFIFFEMFIYLMLSMGSWITFTMYWIYKLVNKIVK